MKALLRTGLFVLGGALAGITYYHFFGCTDSCPITSSRWLVTLIAAIIGGLLSVVFSKEKTE